MTPRYLVIGCTSHVLRAACDLPKGWAYAATTDAIGDDTVMAFFVHWRAKVPAKILRRVECVGFHAAPLPQARGGSPVQNQIAQGLEHTLLNAFRMTDDLDAGPIYMTRALCLTGSADEIYDRIAHLAVRMAREIAPGHLVPVPQAGEARQWSRRTPDQSLLPADADLRQAFDHVRMLDAEGYPHAFLRHGRLRLALRRAAWRGDRIVADVEITEVTP